MFDTDQALTVPHSIHLVPWDTLLSKLKSHYAPSPFKIAHCHAFYHRNQVDGESINHYVAALRSSALDDALLDPFVYGVKDICLQHCLLVKPKVTFQSVLDEACTAKMLTQSLAIIQNHQSPLKSTKPTRSSSTAIHQSEADIEDVSEDKNYVHCLNEAKKELAQQTEITSGSVSEMWVKPPPVGMQF